MRWGLIPSQTFGGTSELSVRRQRGADLLCGLWRLSLGDAKRREGVPVAVELQHCRCSLSAITRWGSFRSIFMPTGVEVECKKCGGFLLLPDDFGLRVAGGPQNVVLAVFHVVEVVTAAALMLLTAL
eukprot:gene8847-biopygen5